jgi:hypothetical protein
MASRRARAYGRDMARRWASEFRDIPATLRERPDLRAIMLQRLTADMPNKATQGPGRLQAFREVLVELIEGRLDVAGAAAEVARRLPPEQSPHAANSHVFSRGWPQRIVHTHFSRLYSQAVLEQLALSGRTLCTVPRSTEEAADSACARDLVGKQHDVAGFLYRLVETYVRGVKSTAPKVPAHPHCTHVAAPADPGF